MGSSKNYIDPFNRSYDRSSRRSRNERQRENAYRAAQAQRTNTKTIDTGTTTTYLTTTITDTQVTTTSTLVFNPQPVSAPVPAQPPLPLQIIETPSSLDSGPSRHSPSQDDDPRPQPSSPTTGSNINIAPNPPPTSSLNDGREDWRNDREERERQREEENLARWIANAPGGTNVVAPVTSPTTLPPVNVGTAAPVVPTTLPPASAAPSTLPPVNGGTVAPVNVPVSTLPPPTNGGTAPPVAATLPPVNAGTAVPTTIPPGTGGTAAPIVTTMAPGTAAPAAATTAPPVPINASLAPVPAPVTLAPNVTSSPAPGTIPPGTAPPGVGTINPSTTIAPAANTTLLPSTIVPTTIPNNATLGATTIVPTLPGTPTLLPDNTTAATTAPVLPSNSTATPTSLATTIVPGLNTTTNPLPVTQIPTLTNNATMLPVFGSTTPPVAVPNATADPLATTIPGATTLPVATTDPSAATTVPVIPRTSLEDCIAFMSVSDFDLNAMLDSTEFVTYVLLNANANPAWGSAAAVTDLPQPLQDTFNSLAPTGSIDIAGASLTDVPTEAQTMALTDVCAAIDDGIFAANNNNAGNSTATTIPVATTDPSLATTGPVTTSDPLAATTIPVATTDPSAATTIPAATTDPLNATTFPAATATTIPVATTDPAAATTAPVVPRTSFEDCVAFMSVADFDLNAMMDSTEFVTYVLLSANANPAWGSAASVVDLPQPLQDTFNSLAPMGAIDITGASLIDTATEAQRMALENVCAAIDNGIFAANNGGTSTATTLPVATTDPLLTTTAPLATADPLAGTTAPVVAGTTLPAASSTTLPVAASTTLPVAASTTIPVATANPLEATTAPGIVPRTSIEDCKVFMLLADFDANSALDASEFPTYVLLTEHADADAWAQAASVTDLPQPLQDYFNSAAPAGSIDITGASPNDVITEAQNAALENTCAAIDEAVYLATLTGSSSPPTATAVPTAADPLPARFEFSLNIPDVGSIATRDPIEALLDAQTNTSPPRDTFNNSPPREISARKARNDQAGLTVKNIFLRRRNDGDD